MPKKARIREIEQRRAREARRRRFVFGGIGVVAALLVIGFAVVKLMPQTATAGTSTQVASAASCSAITSPPDEGRNHLNPGETPTYRGNPPTSGTHNPVPLPAEVSDTPVDVTMEVHSLEHGYIIIQYNDISAGEIQQLKDIVAHDPRKMILAPYPNLPSKISLSAWDHLQTCTGVNPQAIASFIAEFRDQGPEAVP